MGSTGGAVSATATAILDAALAATVAHGIRRTSMADIARRSGVARQTIYRYWPDAQSLFADLVTREVLAQLPTAQRLPGNPEDPEKPEDLDDLVALLVDGADRIRRLQIVVRLRESDPELFSRYILERLGTSQRVMHDTLMTQITAGQQRGFVRAGDAAARAAMLLLVLQSAVQSAPLVAEWLDEQGWRTELSAAVRGLLEVRP